MAHREDRVATSEVATNEVATSDAATGERAGAIRDAVTASRRVLLFARDGFFEVPVSVCFDLQLGAVGEVDGG